MTQPAGYPPAFAEAASQPVSSAGYLTPAQDAANAKAHFPLDQNFDAVDNVERLVTGNAQLQTRPDLVAAMANGTSTPSQAAAVNSFLVGIQAQSKVRLAQSSNTKLQLSDQELSSLDAMGVNYQSVLYTTADAQADQVKQIQAAGDTPIYDQQGNLIGSQKAAAKSSGSNGWFGSVGSFTHHLLHNPVTNALGQGWNTVDTGVSQGLNEIKNTTESIGSGPNGSGGYSPGIGGVTAPQANQKSVNVTQQNASLMTSLGYDPTNPFSVIAFNSRGLSHSDTSDLANNWDKSNPGLFGWDGQKAVTQAELYAANPTKFISSISNDPNMSPQQKAEILENPQFSNLVTEVGGRQSSIGNDFARAVGLDPVSNGTAFKYVSAGTDLAASFLLDPTVALGNVVADAKVAAIGLDSLTDDSRIRAILDPANSSRKAQTVQSNWTGLINDANTIRTADSATQEGQLAIAQAAAHAHANYGPLADMLQDLTGESQFVDKSMTVARGEPITNLGELTEYLASKNGLLRLTGGKAVMEGKLIPGSMSTLGYRALKGKAASAIAGKSMKINFARDAEKLIPTTRDAVDATTGEKILDITNPDAMKAADTGDVNEINGMGNVAAKVNDNADIAEKAIVGDVNAAGDLPGAAAPASAARAMKANAAQKGDLLLEARSGISGQWARMKLAGQRLSSFLPRNNVVTTGDAASAEKMYRFATQFLTKGDAALYYGMWAKGGEGVQKALIDGVIQQTAHAAGLGSSEAGLKLLDEMPDINAQAYGHTGYERTVDATTGTTRDMAVWPTQVRDTFTLPSFQDMQRAGAKLGIWQNTVGRAFNGTIADTFMDYARLAALLKPNIAWRNVIEGQGHVLLRGEYGDMLASRAILDQSAKSFGDKAVADAKAGGETDSKALRQIRREAESRIRTPRKAVLNKAISGVQLDKVGYLYRKAVGANYDPEAANYIREFTEGRFSDELQGTFLGYGQQLPRESPDALGIEATDDIARKGFRAVPMKRVGFGLDDTEGVVGADRYGYALGTRFGKYPDLDRAVIESVRNPDEVGSIDNIVDALKLPQVRPALDQMIRSRQYSDINGVSRVATTDADREVALQQIAQGIHNDAKYLLTDQAGNHIDKVSDYIFANAKAPNAKWIRDNLLDDESRPKAVLAPQFRALAANGKMGFIRSLLDSGGQMYKYFVEDAIKRTTTEPVFLMHYGMQRKLLAGAQKDAEAEIGPEAAQKMVHDLAVKRAYNQTESMIDDPGLKTQADVVGKNFLYFSRAVQAFARRWGGLAIEDPAAFRKLFLANEAAHHAGLTYTDANGNVNFTYPGSDLMMHAMTKLESIVPGLGPAVQYPLSGSLSGQVNMIAPGLNNPARFSLSPMLNTPAHLLEKLAPQDQQLWDQLDDALNGQDAQGKSWYSELVPGAISKFTAANADDRNSALNSAVVSAVSNLYATDPDGTKGIFPGPNASGDQIQTFLNNVKTQVKNSLYLRAAFGEFAPAAPGTPDESNGATKADPLFSAMGVQNLSDEYKQLVNDLGGDTTQARVIFTELHPERLIFTQPASVSTTNKAYLPDTKTAETWIDGSLPFINKYKSVAAYFVPQDEGDFDLNAYNAQIETGLRQKQTPAEFLNQFMINNSATTYYASLDAKNAAVATALNNGDTKGAAAIRANFNAWDTQFNAVNPAWAQNEASEATKQQTALDGVKSLTNLVSDSHVPSNVTQYLPAIKNMLVSYQNHSEWVAAHPAKTSSQISEAQAELADYEDHMTKLVGSDPTLTNIYNGVFKPLNYTVSGG